jgi:NitT/TauT family transport system ATP-binding protein
MTVMNAPPPREPASMTPRWQDVLTLQGIALTYPGEGGSRPVQALSGIDLSVPSGRFVSLIGPSGCGKSTLLRLVADLIVPTEGRIEAIGGTPRQARLARKIGFVFQEAALLDWRRILDNVALPLELRGTPSRERNDRARELLGLVGLAGFETSWPRQLSGGMRQRAAIARALSTEPPLLLMDEPFGALDQITRDRLNMELIRIHEATGVTILFVTHSIREAVLLSDTVVVMTPRPGRIARVIDVALARPRRLETRRDPHFERLVQEGAAELEKGFHDDA